MLNEFTEKVNKITNKITNKAHDTFDVAKLQSAINKAKQDIEETYKEIGKIYYENFALEENELFTEQISRIKDNNTKIITLQEQINQLKGTKMCDGCGKELKQDMSFCPYCGNKQEEAPVEEANAQEVHVEEVHAEEVKVEASEPITRETEVVEAEITPITEEL
jgi:formate dehydrogenase maturation protein FdhE